MIRIVSRKQIPASGVATSGIPAINYSFYKINKVK